METQLKLQKAKSSLIIDQPFFATILLSTPLLEDNAVKTMATNGDSIRYNPAFVDSMTLEETIFVLSHEVLHCVLDHMGRRGTRDPNNYNQAADYIINEILVADKIGSMPVGALYNPQLTLKGNNTTEGVYNLLPAPKPDKKGKKGKPGDIQGGDGWKALDHVEDSSPDPAERKRKGAEREVLKKQAEQIAKGQGKLSSGVKRLIEEMEKSRVDWKEVLRNFISEKVKTEFTWKRPKRRFIAENIYLPSLSGEKLGRITVAVDCSGSVDSILLKKFAGEIQGIRDSVMPSKIDVIYFENEITHTQTFEESDDIILDARGGGGTAFSPIFKHVNNQDESPLCVIVLTDLDCSDFGPSPEYPVLWCVLENKYRENFQVPFGLVVDVREAK